MSDTSGNTSVIDRPPEAQPERPDNSGRIDDIDKAWTMAHAGDAARGILAEKQAAVTDLTQTAEDLARHGSVKAAEGVKLRALNALDEAWKAHDEVGRAETAAGDIYDAAKGAQQQVKQMDDLLNAPDPDPSTRNDQLPPPVGLAN